MKRVCVRVTCKSLRHKTNTWHNISTLHIFISITFRGTSIDETNKTQQKVRGSKFMFKMSTIHTNTCIQMTTPLHNCWHNDGVHGPATSTRSADVLSTPSHHGYANGRPSLEGYLRCCSPSDSNMVNWIATSLLTFLSLSLSAARWQCHVHGKWHDFSDVNITSPLHHQVRDIHGTKCKFTNMISIHLQSCVPKIIKICAYL